MTPRICPVCHATAIYASHRRGLVERGPLSWLGIFPYRCGQCQTRFYRSTGRSIRRAGSAPAALSPFPPRPARWPLRSPADVILLPPGDPVTRLAAATENASLRGMQIRLPVALRAGTRIRVHLPGGEVQVAGVRWQRPQAGAGILHGIRLAGSLGRRTRSARPYRRLRWRQRLRRIWVAMVGLVLMAGAAYGLVWMLESLRVYDPHYYEPKDIEREWHLRHKAGREESRAGF
jgi:hypothetical protein